MSGLPADREGMSKTNRVNELVAEGRMWKVGDDLRLDGITYTIIARTTPESADLAGLKNLAAAMRRADCRVDLGMTRKRGWVAHSVCYYGHGVMSRVVRLG